MEELTNEIRLTNAYPVTDEVGANTKPFRFKLTNTCGVGVDYNLNLEVMGLVDEKSESNPNGKENRIDAKNIAVKVDENNKSILNSNPSATPTYKESDYTAVESYTTYSGSIDPYDSVTHEIRIWLDASAGNDSQNGKFYSKVVIEAKQNQVVRLVDRVQLGDYVEMTPTSTSYTIPKSMTGYSADQTINPSELNLWRVIKINDDGTIEMVSEYTSSTLVYLTGMTGYNNITLVLQSIAEQYANHSYTVATRHVGYNGQIFTVSAATTSNCSGVACAGGCPYILYEAPEWQWSSNKTDAYESIGCGETKWKEDINLLKTLNLNIANIYNTTIATTYWLPSRYTVTAWNGASVYGHYRTFFIVGTNGETKNSPIVAHYDTSVGVTAQQGYRIRPIVTLSPNQEITGDGSLEDPYVLH